MYNCSLTITETKHLKKTYDFSRDIMATKWDADQAYASVRTCADEEIADVLLDQDMFAGVGNIIKNEVLSLTFLNPQALVRTIPPRKLKEVISVTHAFSRQFYRWRKKFVLRKNLQIHRKGACPHCGGKVTHEKTGKRMRISHYCPVCQRIAT
jgi:endonuclease-8